MSLRAAINAKCKDCIWDPKCGGGTWREQVAQCSSVSCPLWAVRPLPESGPWADAPTDPAAVTREWLDAPMGGAIQAGGKRASSGSGAALSREDTQRGA